jgi:hypothetical protein
VCSSDLIRDKTDVNPEGNSCEDIKTNPGNCGDDRLLFIKKFQSALHSISWASIGEGEQLAVSIAIKSEMVGGTAGRT